MTTAARRDTRHKGITRDDVALAAAAVFDEVGVEQLSMRKVAVRLGVTPMALYNHVRDKDELLELTAEHLRDQVQPDTALPPREQLLDLLTQMSELGARHPRLLEGPTLSQSPGAARISAQVVHLLADLGLTAAEARTAHNAVTMLVFGAAQLQRLSDVADTRMAAETLARTAAPADAGLVEAIAALPRTTIAQELRTAVSLVLDAVSRS